MQDWPVSVLKYQALKETLHLVEHKSILFLNTSRWLVVLYLFRSQLQQTNKPLLLKKALGPILFAWVHLIALKVLLL